MASRKIDDLAIDMQILALEFIHECKRQQIDVLIYCTWRSPAEQTELYTSGRTKPGPIKTHAQAGESPHNLSINGKRASRAFDAAPIINGKLTWDGGEEAERAWLKMGRIAEEMGITWGGNWKGKKTDKPHFELK